MTELQTSTLVLFGVVTFVVALLGTLVMRQMARRCGLLARPRADRWHREPVALHGGVGFYSAFFLSACFLLASSAASSWKEWDSISSIPSPLTLGGALVFGSLLMFGLGLWDDLCDLRPATKLVGQLVGASFFILVGGTFLLTGNPMLNQLVTYFWFIGITNAVNMLDNMDGLASGVVIISSVTLILLMLGVAHTAPAEYFGIQLGLMLAAAVAGFWVFNRFPASIFMGDSGSLSIGYLMAGLAVPSSLNGFLGIAPTENILSTLLALIIPAMALAIPIFDTTLVTLTRKWRAQPASQGGRDHSSHRLVCLGLTESTAVRVLYVVSGLSGILALSMQQYPRQTLPLLGVFLSALMISGAYLGRVKVLDAAPAKEVSVLIYGAGHGGKLVLDEIRSHPTLGRFTPLGFVDDDPLKDGHSLCGLPVRSPSRWTEQVLCAPMEIWVSSGAIPHARVSRFAERWNGKVELRLVRVLLEPSPDNGESPGAPKKLSNLTLIPSLERIPISAIPHAPEAR